ncbi:MAG: type II/IV secretion system protein, partial [Ignavibacteriae bacterium]|nr:type II/IV secretion system protein [Ignavibacteriota bacterium]
MASVDITDKIGFTLLKKGIIDYETLEKSLKVKESEGKKNRRNLGQILVYDFNADHDLVFKEVAELYAFRELKLDDELLDKPRIEFIRKLVEALPENARTMMVEAQMLPLKFDDRQPDKLVIIAADPTDRRIPLVARNFNAKKYEVAYCKFSSVQKLQEQVVPVENEFLRLLESTAEAGFDVKEEESVVDEEILEAEISKSALVNLVEGCLVEAVRQGVSDIHVVPREGNRTEFWFRVDGNLKLWHAQESTLPEAIAAVIKDRSKNVDRFEREASQDGFIQRVVDDHQIRFRVSIMPMVGTDFKHKYESIVIRVLDDRKVITDLNKLGLQGPTMQSFKKANNQPQGIVIHTRPTGTA